MKYIIGVSRPVISRRAAKEGWKKGTQKKVLPDSKGTQKVRKKGTQKTDQLIGKKNDKTKPPSKPVPVNKKECNNDISIDNGC